MSGDSEDTFLGRPSEYPATYTPSLLRSIERSQQRKPLGLAAAPDFSGEDVWTGFELSWLNDKGKPQVAGVRIKVPCTSACLVESKSLKLYLNSYAQTRFTTNAEVLGMLNSDFATAFRTPVNVELLQLAQLGASVDQFPGICLDALDITIEDYERNPLLLRLEDGDERVVKEALYTDLFRSVCPVTKQPDWASVMVHYMGRPIIRESLLAYLISFRCHSAFHETTIEQIYVDLAARCQTEKLTVSGRFRRRGGIEIWPFRSNTDDVVSLL